jgi:hypothetical protein
MTRPNNRRPDPGGFWGETVLLWLVVVAAVLAIGGVNVTVRLGARIDHTGQTVPRDLFALFFGVLKGTVPWPPASTWILAVLLAVVVALTLAIIALTRPARRRRTRVDRAATYMGRGRDVQAQGRKAATATAKRLGVEQSPEVPIGLTVNGRRQLYGTWEDMHVDIWGPRTGKTTSRAVPAILGAPGAVLVTSNKRDVVDATRDLRAATGPAWVFDPQGIALEEPTWWWNLLTYVTDEVKASKLAEHFAAGSRDPGARTDAYFDPAGQDLLADLLLWPQLSTTGRSPTCTGGSPAPTRRPRPTSLARTASPCRAIGPPASSPFLTSSAEASTAPPSRWRLA